MFADAPCDMIIFQPFIRRNSGTRTKPEPNKKRRAKHADFCWWT